MILSPHTPAPLTPRIAQATVYHLVSTDPRTWGLIHFCPCGRCPWRPVERAMPEGSRRVPFVTRWGIA